MSVVLATPKVAWRTVALGDVAEMCLGKMLDAKKNRGRLLPYLRNPNVGWFDVDLSDLKMMPFEEHELERYGLRDGDVVMCEGGEAGRAAVWDGRLPDLKFQKAIHRIRTGPALYNRFLVHKLKADYDTGRLAEHYTGTTIKHLTGQDLARYEFELPPLPEQRRIAAILDKADALRAKRQTTLEQLKALTQAVFAEMFDALLMSVFECGTRLSDFANVVSGVTKGRKFDGRKISDVPYLRVANVQSGFLDLSEIKTIPALPEEISALRLVPGDVVLTEGGDFDKLGRGAVWTGQIDNCIHQNHVFRVRVDRTVVLPEFFHEYLQTAPARAYFLRCAKKTTNLASINMTQLRALPVITPPMSEQREFVDRRQRVMCQIELLEADLRGLDGLFASLQKRAFSGTL